MGVGTAQACLSASLSASGLGEPTAGRTAWTLGAAQQRCSSAAACSAYLREVVQCGRGPGACEGARVRAAAGCRRAGVRACGRAGVQQRCSTGGSSAGGGALFVSSSEGPGSPSSPSSPGRPQHPAPSASCPPGRPSMAGLCWSWARARALGVCGRRVWADARPVRALSSCQSCQSRQRPARGPPEARHRASQATPQRERRRWA